MSESTAKTTRRAREDAFERDTVAMLIAIANELKRQAKQLQRIEDSLTTKSPRLIPFSN